MRTRAAPRRSSSSPYSLGAAIGRDAFRYGFYSDDFIFALIVAAVRPALAVAQGATLAAWASAFHDLLAMTLVLAALVARSLLQARAANP
ncbi:MAG: hypothetical protein ABIP29_03720 [Candidatus Eisenbacteria bacterium]